jgi:hypothetical protein
MPRIVTVLPVAVLATLLGCATAPPPLPISPLPARHADLYPLSMTRAGATVAVDQITTPERGARYFGADLASRDILPVLVTVSAHGETAYRVGPANLLLHRRTAVIDALPVEEVVNALSRAQRLGRGTREQFERYLVEVSFAETIVKPGETYQGMLFFPVAAERQDRRRLSWMVLHQGEARLTFVATNAETGERVRFGPFRLSEADHWATR